MRTLIFVLFSIFILESYSFAHKKVVHQYIVREAYKLFENQYGISSEIKNHVGYDEIGDRPWQTKKIVTGTGREDQEDLVYRIDLYGEISKQLGPVGAIVDMMAQIKQIYKYDEDWNNPLSSITHFWDADNGIDAVYSPTIILKFGPYQNAYKRIKSYEGGRKWRMEWYNGNGGSSDFIKPDGTTFTFNWFGRIVFEYQSLIELYKTGRSWIVGTYNTLGQYISITPIEIRLTYQWREVFVWEILGRMAHIIADMSVPAHIHNDEHGTKADRYEDWVASAYTNWTAERTLSERGGAINPYIGNDPMFFLTYTTNQIADHFASEDGDGDNNYQNIGELSSIIPTLGSPTLRSQISSSNLSNIRDATLPYAIRATAGLFYWFAKECNLLPPPFTVNISRTFEFDQTEILPVINSLGACVNVSAPNPYTINGRQYTFLGWSDGDNSNPRNICSNLNVSEMYKMIHKSNNTSAFSNNGQRKLVRTNDGRLYQVYESVGHVWLEHSTDNGITWTLGNNSQPLDNGEGKCPSIDWFMYGGYNALVVAFQQRNGNTYTIQISPFSCQNGKYINMSAVYGRSNLLYTETVDPYTTNANPNITRGYGYNDNSFVLTFERKSGSTAGINWFCGKIYDYGFYPNDYFAGPVWISGTNSNSINASVHLNKTNSYPGNFDVVFQQYVSGASGSIKDVYLYFYKNGQDQWVTSQTGSPFVISSGTGVSNYKPSMVQMPDCNIRVCWIRSLNGDPVNSPFSVNVIYWNSATSSQYTIYGWSAQSVSLNVRDDNARTFYALSQYSSSNQWENYISNGSSYVKLSTAGKDVQLSNGPLTNGNTYMYTSAFYPFTLPYSFQTTSAIGSQLSKASSGSITYGRGAVLLKDDFQFYYTMKNLTVDNKDIKFVDIPETQPYKRPENMITDFAAAKKAMRKWQDENQRYSNLDTLNTVLLSEPFNINDKSSVIFSDQTVFIDSSAITKVLGSDGYVAYKLELIDNATDRTIAAIKESKITSKSLSNCKFNSYNLNVSKVGTKTVRVRITLSTNLTGLQSALVDEYGTIDKDMLAKNALDEITLQGQDIIKEYALGQNYPNPFNPSTVINYQLPEQGNVSIKVYDLLGREVANLVDGMKETGHYSVTFDGSKLSSGIYFIRMNIQPQEGAAIIQVKKMLLTK